MKWGVSSVAAWAPGLETEAAWRSWSEAPVTLQAEGVPDARFLPAMLRRRCTPLSKILLKVAYECCDEPERAAARTVFASRHGSINESIALLRCVGQGERISPAIFTHTVHNAQAGLFSIAVGNREASSSLAAGEDTFTCGLLEALSHLEREPSRPVLFVTGDVPLDATFASLIDEPACSYGVALLLHAGGDDPVRVSVSAGSGAAPLAWPAATEFLRFWLRGERELELGSHRQVWRFERGPGTPPSA